MQPRRPAFRVGFDGDVERRLLGDGGGDRARVFRAVGRAPALQQPGRKIEGQVRGLARMVEEDRYCIDVITQISAVRAALRRVEEEVLRDHVGHCVEHAIASGDKADQRRKIAELMEVISRADR